MTVDVGELYIAEHVSGTSDYRTDVFNVESGAFVRQMNQPPSSVTELRYGAAVGDRSGEKQIYEGGLFTSGLEGAVAVFGKTGTFLAEWNGSDTPNKTFGARGLISGISVGDVAVDGSASVDDWAAGDVYVADGSEHVVDVFEPELGGKEKYVTQLVGFSPGNDFVSPESVTVNEANGDVIIFDRTNTSPLAKEIGEVSVFEPEPGVAGVYKPLFKIVGPPSGGSFSEVQDLATDPTNGNIFVAERAAKVVYEFNSTGLFLGRVEGAETPARTFGEISPASIALDPATNHLYVGDYRQRGNRQEPGVVDIFGPDIVIPDVTTGEAHDVGARSAILTGTVNPDGEGAATCDFAWDTNKLLENAEPCLGTGFEGSLPVSKQATLTELQPDTTYHYRLEATNPNGTNHGEEWQDREFTTLGPGIHGEWVTKVVSESATLDAEIDPHNTSTGYYFEYGTTVGYGTTVPDQTGIIQSGIPIISHTGNAVVSQEVQHLTAGTTYHYRVVAVSEVSPGNVEVFDGPDQTFTTQTASSTAGLPDGRSWELVSPPDKHGALISQINESGLIQAASAGGAFTYVANGPTEVAPKGNTNEVQILATRGAAGWSSKDIATYHESPTTKSVGRGQEYRFFSEDLSSSIVEPFGPFTPLSVAASERTPYLRRQARCEVESLTSECYWPLVTSKEGYSNVPPGTEFNGNIKEPFGLVEFVGGTADLEHVIVKSAPPLTEISGGFALYEWSAESPVREPLQLVSVLPEDEGGTTAVAGQLGSDEGKAVEGAVSRDGTRILWSTSGSKEHLYLRDLAKDETVRLDVSQPGSSGKGAAKPAFWIASSDGSSVLFTDEQQLTAQSGSVGADLYQCEIVESGAGALGCNLRDVTPRIAQENSEVIGVLGGSEDGSSVYFVARGDLSRMQNVNGERAVTGAVNLYLTHYDQSAKEWSQPQFLSTLSNEDEADWTQTLADHTARVSPDGNYMVFMSNRSLTDYNNMDLNSGKPDEEVFLYSTRSGRLSCVSCDPTGARPVGVEADESERLVEGFRTLTPGLWYAANVPGWTPFSLERAFHQSRYLSDSGRVFFNSNDALVPQDVNGTEDVYEFEPPGVGDCTISSSRFVSSENGCVALVSSGTSSEESVFLDATATGGKDEEGNEGGGEVFFLTAEKLVPSDFDTAFDVYDGHECTVQAPCTAQTTSPPVCTTADSCRSAPLPLPTVFGAGPTANISGVGNVVEAATKTTAKVRVLTRAQKLAKGLKQCRRKKGKRRTACEKLIRKRFAPSKNHNTSTTRGGHR